MCTWKRWLIPTFIHYLIQCNLDFANKKIPEIISLQWLLENKTHRHFPCLILYFDFLTSFHSEDYPILHRWSFPLISEHLSLDFFSSIQFSSVAQLCLTPCDPMNRSMLGLPVHHQHPAFTQTHVHLVSDAIQSFHPLSSPSPPAPNPSQH